MTERIDFAGIADAALGRAEQLLAVWLPQGRREGHEWKSVNPMRSDRSEGSFSININTGAWGDFATDDKGGDLVSLCAYLFHGGNQLEAAYDLAAELGIQMPPRKTAQRGHAVVSIRAPRCRGAMPIICNRPTQHGKKPALREPSVAEQRQV